MEANGLGQSDVTKSIGDKDRPTLAIRTRARNADHQGRPVLARNDGRSMTSMANGIWFEAKQ